MIEVELRGALSEPHATQFKEYLDRSADSASNYHEVAVFCNTDHIENFGSFYSGVARIIAVQRTFDDGTVHQHAKFKVNAPTGIDRHEHEMKFAEPALRSFIEMLNRFGVDGASFRECRRYDYTLGDIIISLKIGHVCGDHFEIEATCEDASLVEEAKQKLLEFIEPFNLGVWEPEEYKEVIRASRDQAPYIPFREGIEKFNIK